MNRARRALERALRRITTHDTPQVPGALIKRMSRKDREDLKELKPSDVGQKEDE